MKSIKYAIKHDLCLGKLRKTNALDRELQFGSGLSRAGKRLYHLRQLKWNDKCYIE